MRDAEARLECLKLAVAISHRQLIHKADEIIALSKNLCDYVVGDQVPPALEKQKGKTLKSGQDPFQ